MPRKPKPFDPSRFPPELKSHILRLISSSEEERCFGIAIPFPTRADAERERFALYRYKDALFKAKAAGQIPDEVEASILATFPYIILSLRTLDSGPCLLVQDQRAISAFAIRALSLPPHEASAPYERAKHEETLRAASLRAPDLSPEERAAIEAALATQTGADPQAAATKAMRESEAFFEEWLKPQDSPPET